MVCQHGQGGGGDGLGQGGTFKEKREKGRSVFYDFVRTSIMDGPLLLFSSK